jgi:hypothetical protein
MSDILKEAKEFEHCHEYEHCNADGIIEDLLDYISRLEAAYLKSEQNRLYRIWINDLSGTNAGIYEKSEMSARESLERIKAGDQE